MFHARWHRYSVAALFALLFVLSALLIAFVIEGDIQIGTLQVTFGDIISTFGFLLTALLVLPQVNSLAETSRSAHYSQLDAMYLEILKMAVARPHLLNPKDPDPDRRATYVSYAYIVWNFLETVRDRCGEDETLRTIWAPVIAAEHNLHRDWFYQETAAYRDKLGPKFRIEFVDFVRNQVAGGAGVACGNPLKPEGAWILRPWRARQREDILAAPENGHWLDPVSNKSSAQA
jgi:hypothetical protein